ncbi:MAG: protoheme IX farnesyltransferase [Candidatus Roseilinea sp.]|nr:MAG: protoheme IX farnesyltransferase [Candidatus Roseilinea sp.]
MRANEARTLHRLTLAALVAATLLVVVGNVVRISGEGPSCPDWPLCFGAVLPVDNAKAIAEVVHRALAALTAVLSLTVVAVCLRWRRRLDRGLLVLGLASLTLVSVQIVLGALVALQPWPARQPLLSALHLVAGLVTLGCIAGMHVEVRYPRVARDLLEATPSAQRFRRSVRTLAGATFVALATGALVSGSGAAMACGQTFPICNGGLLPNGGILVFLQWLHRAAVFVVALLALSLASHLLRREARAGLDVRIRIVSWMFIAAFLAVGALGWLMVALTRPAILATLHNATAAALWVSAVALATLVERLPVAIPEPTRKPLPAWRQTINDYVALTKPRVISLLLFTTLAAMFITPAGAPPWYLVVWTLVGGYLMAGGANAVNMAYDSDIDQVMGRTSKRPVPSGRIAPHQAFVFGVTLAGLSFAIFILFVNWLAALLALIGFFYYTVIYTRWLKRSTWQNIVIGGGAGAIPPMIGWVAASSQLSLAAFVLFAIVFYWTPPHFWALALLKRKDYAAAGVPMLPVVAGEDETARQIFIYAFGMFALTLMLVPVQTMGGVYLAGAIALGAWFLWLAWRVNHEHTPQAALRLYVYSLLYLFALFAVMMIDRIAF